MRTSLVFSGLIMLSGTIGFADTIDFKDIITELMQQQKQLTKMTVESTNLDKEKIKLDAKDTQLKGAERKFQVKRQEWIMENGANESKRTEALRLGCQPGKISTDLALVERCNELFRQINNKIAELKPRGERLLAQGRQNGIDREQLSNDTVAWARNRKRVTAVIEDLNARIKGLRDFLSSHCQSIPASATDEEIKDKCGNLQFDGAAPNLPPCQTAECKEYELLRSAR